MPLFQCHPWKHTRRSGGEIVLAALTGKLKVHVEQTFALADAAQAHKQMRNRKTTRKIALIS